MSNDISLRDYFAARAMQSLIAARVALGPDHDESFENNVCHGLSAPWDFLSDENNQPLSFTRTTAEEAYEFADAMLKARQKPIDTK
jgi:hypothetical protein